MAKPFYRQIVVEYNEVERRKEAYGEKERIAIPFRIISWRKDGEESPLVWKEIQCPQKTFFGINGYYGTLGLGVQFYNRTTKKMHKDPPKSVNL